MKKWLLLTTLISFGIALMGCKNQGASPAEDVHVDTVYYHIPVYDTVYIEVAKPIEVIPSEYLEYKLIVLNVKHYVDITEARPANKTYFYGWIRRAVDGVPDLLKRDEAKFKTSQKQQ